MSLPAETHPLLTRIPTVARTLTSRSSNRKTKDMTTYMHLIDTESPPPPDITEPLDATAQLPDSVKRRGKWSEPVDAGRYLQVEGLNRTLAIPIAGELVHLGRGLTADIRIDNRSVSRRHAVLVSRKTGQRILDDRSYNGTFVNGLRVEQAELVNGDVISLGCFLLRFREVPEEARSVPAADTAAATIVASRRRTPPSGLPALSLGQGGRDRHASRAIPTAPLRERVRCQESDLLGY